MIDELSKEMHQFLQDIKENIHDVKTLDYVLKRTEKLYNEVFRGIERIMDYKEAEMDKIHEKQEQQDERIEEMQLKLERLNEELYGEEEFEITCPYCNAKIEANINETIKEIKCPECNNIIELDWNEDIDK